MPGNVTAEAAVTLSKDTDRDGDTSGLGWTLPGDAEPGVSPAPTGGAGQIISFYV